LLLVRQTLLQMGYADLMILISKLNCFGKWL
jgi:hypothetical protein